MAPKKKNHNKNKNDEKKDDESTRAGGPDVSRLDQSLGEIVRAGTSQGRAETVALVDRTESAASQGRAESVSSLDRTESVASRGRAESASLAGGMYRWRPTAASFSELAPVYQSGGFRGAINLDPDNTHVLTTDGNTFATVNNERSYDRVCQIAKEHAKAHSPSGLSGVKVSVFRFSQHARAQATRRLADRLEMGLLPPPPPLGVPLGGFLPGGGATAPALGGGSIAGGSNAADNSAKASGQASQEASGGASGGASDRKRKRGKKGNKSNEGEREEDGGRAKKKTHAELDEELDEYFREKNAADRQYLYYYEFTLPRDPPRARYVGLGLLFIALDQPEQQSAMPGLVRTSGDLVTARVLVTGAVGQDPAPGPGKAVLKEQVITIETKIRECERKTG
ncbi:hypothetical protein DL768_011743 [Monosporascus sp. mg162]|nr:hypothetical protein DL768_011743 [Monosporascus sp. mg162]